MTLKDYFTENPEAALDIYTLPIGMKKSRPGTLIRMLCRMEDRDRLSALLFRHTTILGIREAALRRRVMERSIVTWIPPSAPCGARMGRVSARPGPNMNMTICPPLPGGKG